MTTTTDALARVCTLARLAREADAAAERARAARDEAIRGALATGAAPQDVQAAAGVSRARLYQVRDA